MSRCLATKAKRVYAALMRIGWTIEKQVAPHRKLRRPGLPRTIGASQIEASSPVWS